MDDRWAKSPYSVESMGLEMFQQARWLAVYGAYVALRAHQKMDHVQEVDQQDANLYSAEAAAIANMAAVANGEPER